RRLTPRIKELLKRTPEGTGMLSQLGRPEDGTDPTLPNNLEIFLKLKPLPEWRPGMGTLTALVSEMDANPQEIPGPAYNCSQPIRDNVNENISGQFGQIAVKIYGEELPVLQDAAEKAKAAIAGVQGVADLGIVKSGEMPLLGVKLNRDGLARY